MRWQAVLEKTDLRARQTADHHYSRQTPGSRQFTPPGRTLVLRTYSAVWATSWPFAGYVMHRWAGVYVCSIFRREPLCPYLASDLIRDAVAATLWYKKFGDAPSWTQDEEPLLYDPVAKCYTRFLTFVDPAKVVKKRDFGRCFLRAGWVKSGANAGGDLLAFVLPVTNEPTPKPPLPLGTIETETRRALAEIKRQAGLSQ